METDFMSIRNITVAKINELADNEMKEITLDGDNKILLSKYMGKYYATGAKCTHYGAPLATGVCQNGHVICPWHHAVFNLQSGDSEEPPALDALAHFDVHVKGDDVVVSIPDDFSGRRQHGMSRLNSIQDDRHFVIVGAGAAGEAAVETLRRAGYEGKITMITREDRIPYDRPNLSKEYLSGDAPDEWMPLRGKAFYKNLDVVLMTGKEVVEVQKDKNRILLGDNTNIEYDALLLATGGIARTLNIPGTNLDNIFTLRSFDDADDIIHSLDKAKKAVVIGSSFIGLEAASSLRKRGIDVTVTGPEDVPFEKVFGPEIGKWIKNSHESNGLVFHPGTTAKAFHGNKSVESVELKDGTILQADLVIVGIGVKPATSFLKNFNLNDDGSITVDQYLSVDDNLFAAGDIARYPDWRTETSVRIEHWRLAQQHGRIAAHNMLGHRIPFKSIPFFWTDQGSVHMQYVGHATDWDEIVMDGSLEKGDFIAYYLKDKKILAAASPNREKEIAAIQELMQIDKLPSAESIKNKSKEILNTLKSLSV